MQAIAPPAQHADRVDRRDDEPGDEQGGQQEVHQLVAQRRVEDGAPRMNRGHLAGRAQREPMRRVHPGVGGEDRERSQQREERQRRAQPQVQPRRQSVPAEDVDRDEDRLEKERDPFDGERQPEHVAEAAEQPGPEDAQLEREHRAGHRAHREQHAHDVRPAPGQPERVPIVVAEPVGVRDQREQRQAEAQRHKQDVEAQRERHLASRRQQVARQHDTPSSTARTCRSPSTCSGPQRDDHSSRGGYRAPLELRLRLIPKRGRSRAGWRTSGPSPD